MSLSTNENAEYHVASFIVHTMVDHVDTAKEEINKLEGSEIHAVEEGKIIFTLEADSHQAIGKQMDILKMHYSIMNLLPVYHQYLPEE